VAVDINDETRELRVELPTTRRDHGVDVVTHVILNASLYQAPPDSL
jgi:hypothetical protein